MLQANLLPVPWPALAYKCSPSTHQYKCSPSTYQVPFIVLLQPMLHRHVGYCLTCPDSTTIDILGQRSQLVNWQGFMKAAKRRLPGLAGSRGECHRCPTAAGVCARAAAEQQLQLVIGHQHVQAAPQHLILPHACAR